MSSEEDTALLRRIVSDALYAAFDVHQSLGSRGTERVKKNAYGDIALRGDIEAERAVLDALRREQVPITVHSEEHGVVNIGDSPRFLGVLDGLDGTNRYVAYWSGDRGVRYGTMFSVFDGTDPAYDGCIVAGVMEHPTQRFVLAAKDSGCALINQGVLRKELATTSRKTEFNAQTRTLIDYNTTGGSPCADTARTKYVDRLPLGFGYKCLLSSAAHYVSLALGEADLVLECTRKGNLEIATAYRMVKEAGGVMVTPDGESLGGRKYLSFAQGKDDHVPVITAATPELARDVIKSLTLAA